MIIDGGSNQNFMLTEMVKLNLKVIWKHLIGWCGSTITTSLSSGTIAKFLSLDKYMDQAQCDVILTIASHLLLGWSWLDDLSVEYNAWLNTHSFYLITSTSPLIHRSQETMTFTSLGMTYKIPLSSPFQPNTFLDHIQVFEEQQAGFEIPTDT